ncbi:MAG: YidC/Oxa1 family membrane protein insertase [Lachnospirales bacterium]
MTSIFLSNVIQNDPGVIVGPITSFLGFIFNLIFNFVYSLTEAQSLGITIILLTIVVRFLMMPLAVKSQKSMMAMQKLTPQIEAIKAKYGDIPKEDKEKQMLMNQEVQKVYTENNINPLAGCLPLLIQMPIFVALNYLMNNAYRYIAVIGDLYTGMAEKIMSMPGYEAVLTEISTPMLTKKLAETFDVTAIDQVLKVVNKMSIDSWTLLQESFPSLQQPITEFFTQKGSIEYFFGINLTEASGASWPGILIPLLAGFTTFLTSYISQKQTSGTGSKDPQMKMQQNMMMVMMPIMMGFMTVNLTAGVGVYWITSSVFQIFQQLIIGKRMKNQ